MVCYLLKATEQISSKLHSLKQPRFVTVQSFWDSRTWWRLSSGSLMGFQLSYQLRMSSSEGWTGAGRPASKLTPEAAGGRLQSADYKCSSPHTSVHRAADNMAASFPQSHWSKKARTTDHNRQCSGSYNLILEMTKYYFCRVLSVTNND